MRRAFTSWLRRLALLGWRDIASAPFDCTIELAVIDDKRHPLGFPCVRRAEGWFDLDTMQLVAAAPTHWRYWQPDVPPKSCC
ncbi:hypothetical protein QA639_33120 [Bradyrhizobium pachyrhizi]|nr:hypothetical protein [Bradyrhizobium pachyrhizi]WFU54444.1 hypothetical protein QA639_33120 [Bradyrhizobium pachyrhizi]